MQASDEREGKVEMKRDTWLQKAGQCQMVDEKCHSEAMAQLQLLWPLNK